MQTTTPPFFIAGGTVPSDALCYVTRQADNDLFHALQNAEFCFVLDTRQVGKSSLMARTAERLRASDVRVALLDLTALGKESNPENWHYGLLELIGQELRCLKPLRAFWEANHGLPLTQRFMQAIEQVALEKEPTPLVLAIDEIDFARSLPFDTDDFFAGIRECHNRRAHQPALKRLTFCLIGSATPNDLIQNAHITPFNVGRRVTITDFTPQEATPLADGLSSAGKDGKTFLAQILYWTNGHPYLTQRLCAAAALDREVSGAGDIDGLAKRLFLSRRASATEDVNLTFARDRLLKSDLNKDRLFGLYQTIHEEKRAIADDPRDPYCNALRLSGIVAERAGYLFVRNRIYRELFTPSWAQEQMPGIEAAQRRREVRRARLQVAGVAGCIIAGMGGLAYNANQQYQRANNTASKLQIALTDTQNARSNADRYLYIASMNLAQRDYEANNIGNVRSLLDETRNSPYRGFEWGYWNRLCHRDLKTYTSTRSVYSVAFYPNGKRIVTGGFGEPKVWDVQTGKRLLTFKGYAKVIYSIAFSPDGTRIVTSDQDGRVKVWNAATGRELLALQHVMGTVWSAAFSPDGKRIGTGNNYGTAQVWDAVTGHELLTLEKSIDPSSPGVSINSIAFSPDNKRIVTGSNDTTAKVWDSQTGKPLLTLKGHTNSVDAASFSPDSKRLVTGSEDNTAKVWDADTGKEITVLKGHTNEVHSAAFSPDGKHILTGSWDNTARVWDAVTGREILMLKGHANHVNSAAFSPDGKRIITGSTDRSVKMWEAQKEPETLTLTGQAEGVGYLDFSYNNTNARGSTVGGKRINAVSRGQDVKIRDTQTGSELLTLPIKGVVYSVAFSPDGKRLVTNSVLNGVQVWDVETRKEMLTLKGHNGEVWYAAFSPDGRRIITRGEDHTIRLWDAVIGRELLTLEVKIDEIQSIAFSPDGKRIVARTGQIMARTGDTKKQEWMESQVWIGE